MKNRHIKTNLGLHLKLLQLVYDSNLIEVEKVKDFIKQNYSFNDNTVSTAYRKLCGSGFIEVRTIGSIKYLTFHRNK